MRPRTSTPVSVFEKVLRAFETGGFTFSEVRAQLMRLLAIGASPMELLEILRRRQSIEPLPEYAHIEMVGILNAAIARADAKLKPTKTSPFQSSVVEAAGKGQEVTIDLDELPFDDGPRAPGEGAGRRSASEPGSPLASAPGAPSQLPRPSRMDLHSTKEAESGTAADAAALAADLAAARSALESEKNRARKIDKELTESIASAEAARSHGEAVLRESERFQTESRTLRDALAERDATIAKVQHSLGERDAQLAALQQERAKIVPALEAGAKAGTQLEADLQAARAHATALAADLTASRAALEAEQNRVRELDKGVAQNMASAEAARSHAEEGLRESQRLQTELRTLRDALAARDATIANVLRSLGERDAQLAALQEERARMTAALEARAKTGTQLEADLQASRARATALAADLTAAHTALESEQNRVRKIDRELAERAASAEAARSRGEEARRESERFKSESRTLRDSLAARDATIAKVQHSLGERDAQLAALQQERAKMVPALEARAKAGAQLEADLQVARAHADATMIELRATQQAVAQLKTRLKRSESQLNSARSELGSVTTQSNSFLERLRTREWRRGFDQNLSVESGGRADAADAGRGTLRTERDRSQAQVATLRTTLDAQDALVDELGPAANADAQRAADAELRPQEKPGLTAGSFGAKASAGRRGRARNPRGIALALGLSAAVCLLAVVAWFFAHRTPPLPVPVPVPAPARPAAAMPKAGTVIHDCPTCPVLTILPAGRFKQGSADAASSPASFEKPLHRVAISRPFAMSTTAVTVDEFQQFVAATGRDMQGCDTYDGEWKHRRENSWKNPGFAQTGTHPVTCASWNDAEAYARWLSTTTGHRYRLPSASEWEYAARAGGEAVQPWNPDGSGACANANVADASAARRYPGWAVFACDDGYVYTAPVGSFKANSFGLNDMLGNVLQWTEDCWHPDYTGAPIDGSARMDGNCSEHELRGGSWFSTPAYVRANYRNHFAADYRASSVGIRLVRDLDR
jgi:formylglycine-generating enzyme required for sulfatase activity